MHYSVKVFLHCCLCAGLLLQLTYAKSPDNLSCAKRSIIHYYQSGEFEKDVADVMQQAEQYLLKRITFENSKMQQPQKLAIILDIDETSVSNFIDHKKRDFADLPKFINASYIGNDATVIKPVLQLYNTAVKNGVDVFFVSSRPDEVRPNTIKTLQDVGYYGWKGLYLPNKAEKKLGAQKYKMGIRKTLSEQGYKIILNVGDQDTDLNGGYAERTYKVPNPMYTGQCGPKQGC